ncbi:MAG: sortase domain-containing protein [Ilumatobacteraceae bacterium]
MTATATLERSATPVPDGLEPDSTAASNRVDVPPLGPRLQLIRGALVLVLVLSMTLLIQLVVVSSPEQSAAQRRALDSFRSQLAKGTAPIGPSDSDGRLLRIGTPVAYLEIPSIGVHQVVGEGTTSGALFHGPGHRRDTPLPGQIGSSVVYGRRASYGRPFSRIDELNEGDLIRVTTGQGIFQFHVLDVRRTGDPAPAPIATDGSRLLLITAAGTPFFPNGVVRVDADLDGKAVVGPAPLFTASDLPAEEKLMAGDSRALWTLALWLQALIVLTVGAVWAWHRWGRAQAWVVFLPPLLLVGLFACGEVIRLLPNLL